MTNGVDYRSQSLVGHSRGEAGVAHGGNEMGVEVHVREGRKAAVDPYETDGTRVSIPEWQVRILRF